MPPACCRTSDGGCTPTTAARKRSISSPTEISASISHQGRAFVALSVFYRYAGLSEQNEPPAIIQELVPPSMARACAPARRGISRRPSDFGGATGRIAGNPLSKPRTQADAGVRAQAGRSGRRPRRQSLQATGAAGRPFRVDREALGRFDRERSAKGLRFGRSAEPPRQQPAARDASSCRSLRLRQIDPTTKTAIAPSTEETYSTRSRVQAEVRRHAENRRGRVEIECNLAIEQPLHEGMNCRVGCDHVARDPPEQRCAQPDQNRKPVEHHHDQRCACDDHRNADCEAEDRTGRAVRSRRRRPRSHCPDSSRCRRSRRSESHAKDWYPQ